MVIGLRRVMGTLTGRVALVTALGCGAGQVPSDAGLFRVERVGVGFEPADVLVHDLDRDGDADVVVSGEGSIRVLRGDGSGSFRTEARVEAGDDPVDLAVGDLDGDGWADLVVANHETDYLTLLFGAEAGFSAERSRRLAIDVDPHPHAVVLADLDGDGHLDILVDDRGVGALDVLTGRGDGTFGHAEPIAVGGDPYRGMAVGDLDGDGHLDVATPNPRSVMIVRGDGAGRFEPLVELATPALRPFGVVVADLDGDGLVDVGAGSGEGAGALAVWLATDTGEFTPAPDSPWTLAQGPTAAVAHDLDGNGASDVVVTSWNGEISILFGDAHGMRIHRVPIDGNPWNVAAGNLDGRGMDDLVVPIQGSHDIAFLFGAAERE